MGMKLYNLGKLPWDESQLIYHALAGLGREALCLVSPSSHYVCIGFHQDLEQEVDLDFCRERGIPVFRRDLGGGAVYLDGNQLFFQLILKRKSPLVPANKEAFYKKFLAPAIEVYRTIGIPAEYRPINDIIAGTRKISGTGASEIGECIVFVGNLIVDFDYETMCRVLRVPDEKFRDKVQKTLKENLSTIRRELGEFASEWPEPRLNRLMRQSFERLLGRMEPCGIDDELRETMDKLRSRMLADEWLFQRGRRYPDGRDIKIRAGTNVIRRMHKAMGGLIRAEMQLSDGRLSGIHISGDFFCFPESGISQLESYIEGLRLSDMQEALERFYGERKVETPGIEIRDWLEVLGVKEKK